MQFWLVYIRAMTKPLPISEIWIALTIAVFLAALGFAVQPHADAHRAQMEQE